MAILVTPDTIFKVEHDTMVKPRSMYEPDTGMVEYVYTGLSYHWINGHPVTGEEFNEALARWRKITGTPEQQP